MPCFFRSLALSAAVLLFWGTTAGAEPPQSAKGRQQSTRDLPLSDIFAPQTAKVANVGGQPVVQVNDNFERAWRRVGLALDRTGFFTAPAKRPSMIRTLRNALERADLHRVDYRSLLAKGDVLSGLLAEGPYDAVLVLGSTLVHYPQRKSYNISGPAKFAVAWRDIRSRLPTPPTGRR